MRNRDSRAASQCSSRTGSEAGVAPEEHSHRHPPFRSFRRRDRPKNSACRDRDIPLWAAAGARQTKAVQAPNLHKIKTCDEEFTTPEVAEKMKTGEPRTIMISFDYIVGRK
jgi:hypothetical protein